MRTCGLHKQIDIERGNPQMNPVTNALQFLETTAATASDKQAFIGENTSLNFGQVLVQSRAVGSALCAASIYKKPVAIFMEKGPQMLTAFFGAVYAGNYYIPLDAEMPEHRIRMILELVEPAYTICDASTAPLLETWGIEAVCYTSICDTTIDDDALCTVRRAATDADPMYIVFTSGSTGTPKGVVANHRGLIDYINCLPNVLGASESFVFGLQSPLYLDAFWKEAGTAIKYGASVVFIPKQLFMFPVRLLDYMREKNVNTVCWVASALSLVAGLGALDTHPPTFLHTVAFGSEVFPIQHFTRWRNALPQARFIHLYGPTEATGMSAYYEVDRDFAPGETIPIGKALPNTQIILIDENGNTPQGNDPGEICIRGTCLSGGYYKDEEKTRAAFVQNPQSPYPDIIYKTGDMGYINDHGELCFLARRDHQIKHMGHRIELAEIELTAAAYPGVQMACTVFDAERSRIVLYFVSETVQRPSLMAHLKNSLPRYMVPFAAIALDKLPLTPGGKIDRVGLLQTYKQK